ncbi:MAG: glycosyltransferase family 39 protein [Anaerolineae bacterium]|nr:glycosyltransferase family 39 protein [Thermoflexales bacterium]HQW34301.1 glycosyltransferase family 39 protein [Thermoflexales bacterium]
MKPSSRLTRWLAFIAILLLAAALRFYKLDAQSFWYDEGNSARLAERSVALILDGAAKDIHPPLYYLALGAWRMFAGGSEFALRALSAFCGILMTALAAKLVKGRAGMLAALFVAVSPFAVYYSQEARMYALLALFATLTSALLLRLLNPSTQNKKTMLALALGTAAGLYTHYAYPFVMLAQGLVVLMALAARRDRALFRAYVIANAIALLAFAPWLPVAVSQITGWGVAAQEYALGPAMLDAARWVVVGRTATLDQAAPALVLFGLGIGYWILDKAWRKLPNTQYPIPNFILLLLLVIPFALLFVFKLYRESYLKFLLVCVPPLAGLMAQAIWPKRTARVGAGLAALAVCAAFVPSLNNLYNNPAYARDDYRGIAQRIAAVERPGDAILFDAPNQWEVFTYYHRDDTNLYPLAYAPVYKDVVAQTLDKIVTGKTRLFVLYFAEKESDPNGWYEEWLAANTFKSSEEWFGAIRLAVYAVGRKVDATSQKAIAKFGDAIELRAASAQGDMVAKNGLVPVELVWRANAKPDRRYKIFIHVAAPGAAPISQMDSEPAAGFAPTTAWNAGQDIMDRRGVWLKPGAPPGAYAIYVGMYDLQNGQRLPVFVDGARVAEDQLRIGEVVVP